MNDDLKDEVYMTQPKRFIKQQSEYLQIKEFYLWAVIDLSPVIYFLQGNCFIVY
jgi:hypothetical protein